MDLREFVAETLTQIVEGVKEAQTRAKDHGAQVNPHLTTSAELAVKQTSRRSASELAITGQYRKRPPNTGENTDGATAPRAANFVAAPRNYVSAAEIWWRSRHEIPRAAAV